MGCAVLWLLGASVVGGEAPGDDSPTHFPDQVVRNLTRLEDEEALALLCSPEWGRAGSGHMNACLVPVDDASGGGMGATLGSVMEFVLNALEHGCTYVHRSGITSHISHHVANSRLEEYFGLGHGCLLWDKIPPRIVPKGGVEPEDSVEALEWSSDVVGTNHARPADGVVRAVVKHGTTSRTGVHGPCEDPESLKTPTLCLLGRGRIRKMQTRNRLLTRQIARYWWSQHDMPEKQPSWFEEANRGIKGYHVNIVVHIRRGDVGPAMRSRYVSNDVITEMMSLLAAELVEVREAIAEDRSKAAKAVTNKGLHYGVHVASQGHPEDFPLAEWEGILDKAGARLVTHLAPKNPKELGSTTDELVLPTFTHMILADVLFHGHSSFPALVERFYGLGLSRGYGTEAGVAKLPDRFSGSHGDRLVAYIIRRAGANDLWLNK